MTVVSSILMVGFNQQCHKVLVRVNMNIPVSFGLGKDKTGRLLCLMLAAGIIDDVIILVPDGKTHLWIDSYVLNCNGLVNNGAFR